MDEKEIKEKAERYCELLILYDNLLQTLEAVTKKKQLAAFRHKGFWQCMDTKRDKDKLNKILNSKKIKFESQK